MSQVTSKLTAKGQLSKVFVGMSGGVDSSVSAALLKKAGYDVTGVFIKVWQPKWLECTWREDRLDAMRVCAKLGIPFVTLDLSTEYKHEVVDYMIAEYKAGRTPNPDVMCNRHVKFGGFYRWAMKNGADYVATGHYARVRQLTIDNLQLTGRKKVKGQMSKVKCFGLLAGSDQEKDQSYFLWTLTQEQLSHTLFPVGGMTKPEVRKLAKKFGLPVAEKKDSQGLCFLGKIDVKEFLKNYIKPKRGKVLDEKGQAVGTHDGAFFYTIGERIPVSSPPFLEGGTQGGWYVISKDMRKNTLTVSHKFPDGTLSGAVTEVSINDCNWIIMPKKGKMYQARIRYRQPLQEVRCKIHDSRFTITFKEAQTVAPGQSIVFYDGEVCLGGGIIK